MTPELAFAFIGLGAVLYWLSTTFARWVDGRVDSMVDTALAETPGPTQAPVPDPLMDEYRDFAEHTDAALRLAEKRADVVRLPEQRGRS